MKHACFYSINNPHETGQNDFLQNQIKNMLGSSSIKQFLSDKLKYLIAFCLIVFLTGSAFAVDIRVSGITNPSDANGTYLPYATNTWKLSVSGKEYYIWYYIQDTSNAYWIIDNSTDGADGIYFQSYNCSGCSSPANASGWQATSPAAGSLSVSEVTVNPEINIKGNSVSITSGSVSTSFSDYTKFGSALPSSGNATRTFTIENTGSAALTIGAISFSGTNAGEFTVTSAPAASVAALGSTTFTVRFAPTDIGNRTATISIPNNDSNENPYTFAIDGFGYTPTTLLVSGFTATPPEANEIYISQGVLNGFQYWKHRTLNYYIYNVNGTTWTIDNNLTAPDGSLASSASATNIPAGLTWTNGSYIPEGGSTYTASTGTVAVTGIPATHEINVKGYNGISIVNGDNTPSLTDQTHFGSAGLSTGGVIRTFTILNEGGTTLTLTGSSPYVSISGANASDFTVTAIPSSSIASCTSTTFQITFIPSASGTRTATVTIANNDSDEGTFTFDIKGDGIFPQTLNVSGITTPAEADGNYTFQGIMNNFAYWRHTSGSYYIYYTFRSDYTYTWVIDTDLNYITNPVFSTTDGSTGTTPVGTTSWSTSSYGVAGSPVITSLVPEINVQGNGTSIASGDVIPLTTDYTDFGSVLASSGNISHTFTIQNIGSGILYLYGTPKVVVSGTNASDFTVTAQPTSPVVATTGTTTFTVLFDPSAIGVRTATVSIANDDSDENPYTFSIQGTGYAACTATTNAAGSITSTGATLNGTVNANGASTTVTFDYGITNAPYEHTSIAATPSTVTGTSATAVTYALTGLTPNTTYHCRVNGVNTAGTTNGSDLTFTTAPAASSTFQTSGNWSTASNWSAGLPASTTDVTLAANCNVDGNAPAKNVTVNPGIALTITTGNTLSVSGNFILKSNASNGTATLIDNGILAVSGTSSVEQYLTIGRNWYISSPVSGATTAAISNAAYVASYSEPTASWVTESAALTPLKGYVAVSETASAPITFTGILNTGNQTNSALTATTANATYKGYNLVGNPYPSYVDWAQATKTNLLTTMWYRTTEGGAYKFYTYNSSGSTGVPASVTSQIPPMQAFWVRVDNIGTGTLSFTNAMRAHQSGTNPLKAPAAEKITTQKILRLQVSNGTNGDEAVVYFNPNAADEFDAYDSEKMSNNNAAIPEIYTLAGTEKAVINGLNKVTPNKELALGFTTGETNTFTIKATEIGNFDTDTKIILKDKLLNTEQELTSATDYSFSSDPVSTASRFSIVFKSASTVTGIDNSTDSKLNLTVFRNANGYITITRNDALGEGTVTVSNALGQKLADCSTAGTTTVVARSFLPGVYLVTVNVSGRTTTKKIILN